MTLPSQSARPNARSSYMYSRRRHRLGPMILLGLLVVVGGYGAWRLWGRNDAAGTTDPARTTAAIAADRGTSGVQPGAAGPTGGLPVTPSSANREIPPAAPVEIVTPDLATATDDDADRAATPTPDEDRALASTPERTFESPVREAPPSIPGGPDRTSSQRGLERLTIGLDLQRENRLVEARRVLSDAYMNGGLSRADAEQARAALMSINDLLVFSPTVIPGDPHAYTYTMKKEFLGPMLKREGVKVNYRFIERINRTRATRLREGQGLKLVRGPFHAVISKRDYRMDLYMGDGAERVFVTSLPVGLGEYDSTPAGRFRLLRGSKVENPAWTNPRTGEQFGRDDPENPIGEFWIGLEGVDPHTEGLPGYGIHGTIEPESIGRQMSMGCVRLLPDDIALVFELLTYPDSTVEIIDDRI